MAIDLIRGGRIANRGIRTTKSSNAYLKTLIKVPSIIILSSTPSWTGEPTPSSIKPSIRDSTNRGLIDTPSPSPELSEFWARIASSRARRSRRAPSIRLSALSPNSSKNPPTKTPSSKSMPSMAELSLLLDLLPMTIDFSNYPKAWGSAPSNSQTLPEPES